MNLITNSPKFNSHFSIDFHRPGRLPAAIGLSWPVKRNFRTGFTVTGYDWSLHWKCSAIRPLLIYLDLLSCNSWLVHQCRLDLRAPPSCVSDMTLPSCYANNGPTADTSQSFPLPGAGPNDISSYTSLSCMPWGQHTFITSEVERQTARAQGCGCTGGTPSVWVNTLKYSLLYN